MNLFQLDGNLALRVLWFRFIAILIPVVGVAVATFIVWLVYGLAVMVAHQAYGL